jgi:hypothetical protein
MGVTTINLGEITQCHLQHGYKSGTLTKSIPHKTHTADRLSRGPSGGLGAAYKVAAFMKSNLRK